MGATALDSGPKFVVGNTKERAEIRALARKCAGSANANWGHSGHSGEIASNLRPGRVRALAPRRAATIDCTKRCPNKGGPRVGRIFLVPARGVRCSFGFLSFVFSFARLAACNVVGRAHHHSSRALWRSNNLVNLSRFASLLAPQANSLWLLPHQPDILRRRGPLAAEMDFLGPLSFIENNLSRSSAISDTPLSDERNVSVDDDEHNTSTASTVYSADEQIIRQRGPRSPHKNHRLRDYEQAREEIIRLTSNRNLFPPRNQQSITSDHCSPPGSQGLKAHHQALKFDLSLSPISSSKQPSASPTPAQVRRRSLLRTPIKKRLRRNANVLSQVRKSHCRRYR